MKEFSDKFKKSDLQPQVFSLLLITIILVILAIVVYIKVKKQEPSKAPSGFLLITEQYVMGVDQIYKEVTNEKITKPAPYIFTLLTLLLFSNLMGIVGLDIPATSYSFTFTLALISWIGIYVVGIMYQKMRFFKKFLNPVELIGQFAPLISLSFRMFGNLLGGATILFLWYAFTGYLWGFIPVIGEVNLLAPIVPLTEFMHGYFDIFGGIIQAFVFSLLTMVYWSLEADEETELSEEIIEKKQKLKEDIQVAKAI